MLKHTVTENVHTKLPMTVFTGEGTLDGLSDGAIAGIVIAVIIAVALVVVGVWHYCRQKVP